MKIGLYFGSFNPIHIGHLIIATYVTNNTDFEKIWFVISPQNPLKFSKTLLNEYQRLHLLRLAIEDDYNLNVCDVEFKLPKPSYTIDTITHLKEKYPQHQFAIIMGSDSVQNLSKWKKYQQLIEENNIIIFRRPGFELDKIHPSFIILNDTPLLDISSTAIRNMIKLEKSIRYLVPEKVQIEIENCRYYKVL